MKKFIEIVDSIVKSKGYKDLVKFCENNEFEQDLSDCAENFIFDCHEEIFPECSLISGGSYRLVFEILSGENVVVKFDICEEGENFNELELYNRLKTEKPELLKYINTPIYTNDRLQVYPRLDDVMDFESVGPKMNEIIKIFKDNKFHLSDLPNREDNFGINEDGELIIADYGDWTYDYDPLRISDEDALKLSLLRNN